MSYPGNSSLAPEIQQRIQATFEQTLELAGKGNQQEALLGCDFILRLDPLFDPARKLQSRLEQATGPVDVSDLGGEEEAPGETSFSDLDNLALETQVEPLAKETSETAGAAPEPPPTALSSQPNPGSEPIPVSEAVPEAGVESTSVAPKPPSPPTSCTESGPSTPSPTAPATDAPAGVAPEPLLAKLEELFADRRFDELKETIAAAPPGATEEPAVAALLARVQEALEAEPYVKSFLERARKAKEAGNSAEATRLLEKARALDPDHPGIAEIEGLEPEVEPAPVPSSASASSAAPPAETSLDMGEGVDLSTPQSSEDDDPRIAELLKEGQAAFDEANYQGAIDAWSRIFLINIDHPEANRRIEIARQRKAEGEREIEQQFHEALAHADAGETQEAKAGLEKVLELAPGHMAAREALEGLEAGHSPTAPAAEESEESDSDIDLGLSDLDLSAGEEEEAQRPLKHQILVPPEPGEESSVSEEETAPSTVAVKSRGARRRFFAIGIVVLIAVVGAGWFLYTNRDRLFHNTGTATAQSSATTDPVARAKQLAKEGKTDLALSLLRRMPPSDPGYSEAQVLIAQWEAASKSSQAAKPAGPSAAELATREQWLQSARAAADQDEYLVATEWLSKAASIAPLKGDEAELKERCDKELAPIGPEINLFRQGEWELVLPRLWRLHQVQPGNKTVTHLIVNSYYDLGVRDLQREEVESALSKFNEAVKLAPADTRLQRLVSFCKTYRQRSPDLLYQIYVKYLPFR
ncbi:MAG TPA: hypothetical protein VKA53_02625 [Thermoanaerobaculia bacterium]|nr:hypothetical protein [Thermoanaerobaculia bacterium]